MEVTITGRRLEVTDPIRVYAEERADRLLKYYDRIGTLEIVLERQDSRSYRVELIAHVPNHEHFVAHGDHDDLYKCIDETASKVERQLHDFKERLKDHKNR